MSEKENEEAWGDLVLKYFPNATEEEMDFILWEKTCYPFGTADQVEKQILEFKVECDNRRKS